MPVHTTETTAYEIRSFSPGDRTAFRSLYEDVFDRPRSEEWFRWKFEDNPFADHVPIVVAERDGEPVGFRSFFPLEMRIGEVDRLAYQPCDTMVHPDHRRRGLFSRMNELALERYADGGPSFFFNFPNEQSTRGNVKHGWREVGTIPMYYRPQNPVGALRRCASDDPDRDAAPGSGLESTRPVKRVEEALATATSTTHRVQDRLVSASPPDGIPPSQLHVERYDSHPVDRLAAAYRRWIPDEIHAVRSETFLEWRLANPAQRYESYVAERDGEPIAALIVSPQPDHLRIVDALPRAIDAATGPLQQLLLAALDDHADSHFVTAFGRVLPTPLRYRFYPDTKRPLSTLLEPTSRTLYARDVDDLGLPERPTSDWALSRLDLDTT